MAMEPPSRLSRSLDALRVRLHYVNRAWTVENYQDLLRFYVHIVPRLVDAERCGIFIRDPANNTVLSKVGTGIEEGEISAPLEGSVVGRAVSSGECIVENDMLGRSGYHRTIDEKTGFVTRSMVCAPIKSVIGDAVTGAIQVLNKRPDTGFTEDDAALVQEIARYLSMALDNVLVHEELETLSGEIDRELSRYHASLIGDTRFVAESAAMRKVLEVVRMVSATPVDVVIQGENGTGKELIARMIHDASPRADGPFVAVNCAAIPETLMESEFFGYEKGAFTGAAGARGGRFEEAHGGTLFLDEIADLPLPMQPKFLRAIQEGEGTRLGSSRVVRYDLRLISATNRNLHEAVATGAFRQDLFYRLFAVEIVVPPLRERREDVAPLALAFLDDVCRRFGKSLAGFSSELLATFEAYHWPGNVRQLRREVERLVALTPAGQHVTPDRCSPELLAGAGDGPARDGGDATLPERVRELEMRLIEQALERTGGNKVQAARLLGITRQGLHKKLGRYRLAAGAGNGAAAGR